MRPGLLCFNYSSCQKKKITSILMAGAADRGALAGYWEQVEEEGGGEMEEGSQTPPRGRAWLVRKTHPIPLVSSL